MRLAEVLDEHGDRSFEARRALLRWRNRKFAWIYARTPSPAVRRTVEAARAAGVPLQVLRTLVSNNDIRATPVGVRARRSWWLGPLTRVSQAVVLAQALLLLTYILSHPAANLWMKVLLSGAILIFYASGYYVWGLYTVRPMKFLARYGARINEIAETEQTRDAVVRLASHGGSSPRRPC